MARTGPTWLKTLPVWLSAAWAMGLSTLGLFVVPMLFAHLPSPAIAGAMAGQLFGVQTWISVILVVALLLLARRNAPDTADQATDEGREAVPPVGGYSAFLLAGGLMALLVQFGATPHILAHDNLPFWHGVASALYLGQWICALMAFAKNVRGSTA